MRTPFATQSSLFMRHLLQITPARNIGTTAPWLAGALLCALAFVFIVLGHDGRRVAQLTMLLLPPFALLCIRLESSAARRLRALALWSWVMLFIADGAARGYLQETYHAAPNGALVLGAAANTNVREGNEYLLTQWRSIGLWVLALLAAGAITWRAALPLQRFEGLARGVSRPLRWALLALLCLMLLVYASKPWRRLHPVAFWGQWFESVQALRDEWSDQRVQRTQAHNKARALAPTVTHGGPSTVVLVISDSVNRDNMSIYGYPRDTTPRLQALQQSAGPNMLLMRHAWSVEASTLPALHRMFNIPVHGETSSQHLLALARSAGYRVWWVSNHDDLAIEQQHAQLADVAQLINRTPGRSSESLDGELLDEVKTAIADPHERKLIVVHLLGTHPHYRLRFPENQNPFDDETDAVERQLLAQGRPGWIRNFRHEYDAALLYHDGVVAELLRMTQKGATPDQHTAWMYLSDHGQEVGHTLNHAGHSPGTASGFRIPAIVWRSEPFAPSQGGQPFRNDWAAFTVADLMRLQWRGQMHERNVLSPNYAWQPPELPFTVTSFAQ